MEMTRDTGNAKDTSSQHKQKCNVKFIGAVSGNGAFIFASRPCPGRCTGPELTEASGYLHLIHEKGITRADKGFMMHAKFDERGHKLEVPEVDAHDAHDGQSACSSDQMRKSAKIARARSLVERAFRRAQKFMILRNRVPIIQIDQSGIIFRVCCYLYNFQPPLPDDHDAKRAMRP